LIIHLHEDNVTASGISKDRPSPFASQLSWLEVKHSHHWPSKRKQQWWCVCLLQWQICSMLHFCKMCDIGLCVVNCCKKWYMNINLSHLTQVAVLNGLT
jgi:hypothetical protein